MNILNLLLPKSTVAYVYDENTLRQALEKIRVHQYTAIPVINRAGEYIGTVREGDFLWHMIDNDCFDMKIEEEFKITDIISENWNPAIKIDTPIGELLLKVMDQNFVPVVDDRNLFMGIITRRDVLKYFYDRENKRQEVING